MTLGAAGTDWLLFFGRLHPLVVHLPIGLLVAVVLAETIAVFQRPEKVILLRKVLVLCAALSAIVSATVGWFLASEGGYAQGLLFWHRWGGIAFAALMLLGFVLICSRAWASLLVRAGVLLSALGLMTIVGHLGGSMTHGETYLARYAPGWLQGVLGGGELESIELVPVDGLSGDAQAVFAMFTDHCVECHGPTKQKGKLRLDQTDGILSTLVPGDPGMSELLRRLTLPRGHEDLMPPESDPLPDELILATLRWIRDGAHLGSIEKELEAMEARQRQQENTIAEVEELSGAVISQVPVHIGIGYVVNLSIGGGPLHESQLAALRPIADRIAELNIAGREVESVPEGLAFSMLTNLHAERSSITTSQLRTLVAGMPELASLNIHSTAVDDALIEVVDSCPKLREVTLFGTPVTDKSIAMIRASHPDLRVLGAERLEHAFAQTGPRLILAADYSTNRIAMLREVTLGKPVTVWEHEIGDIHDLHLLENGNILFQTSWTQLIEIDPDQQQVVWSYDAATQNRAYEGERVEVHAFERLPNGNTMIAESGPARIIEVDPSGRIMSEVPLNIDHPDAHHDTRLVRTTQAGTYLVAHEKDGFIREYDRSGVLVWEYDIPVEWTDPQSGKVFRGDGDQAFSAIRRANGNTLIGTGNGHSVIEVSPDGEIVWGVAGVELEGIRLAWVTTVQELSNGNIVIGNCHAGEGQPQIVEITRDKRVVWKFHDFERFGNALSNSFVTEDPDGFAYTNE